jgi:hypothetical protein
MPEASSHERAMKRVRREIERQLTGLAAQVLRLVVDQTGSGPLGFTVLLMAFAALVKVEQDAHRPVPPEVLGFAEEANALAHKALDYLEADLEAEVPKRVVP